MKYCYSAVPHTRVLIYFRHVKEWWVLADRCVNIEQDQQRCHSLRNLKMTPTPQQRAKYAQWFAQFQSATRVQKENKRVCDVPHWSLEVRQLLSQNFNENWYSRGGPTAWPPSSPDLSPPDFSLWGYIKNHVHIQRPRDIPDLRNKIAVAIEQITSQMLDKTWKHMATRYRLRCECQGGHAEVYWFFL